MAAEKKIFGFFLTNGENRAILALTMKTFPGQSLGVFSLSEIAEGVTIEGAAYALSKGTLKNDFSLGVSNTALGKSVTLTVEKGILLAVLSFV